MKIFKKLYALAAFIAFFVSFSNMFSAMVPIQNALVALSRQKFSMKVAAAVRDSVERFVENQQAVAQNFKEEIEGIGGIIVKDFAIPEEHKKSLSERLKLFTPQPVFFRSADDESVPYFGALKAFNAVGLTMNKAAEKAFWNTDQKEQSRAIPRIATEKDFNRAQMEVMLDHECIHVKNGDADLKTLFIFLSQNKEHFSDDEFYQIMGAFGEDFLSHRKVLAAAIIRDAEKIGIHDLRKIENFDRDVTAYNRYYETRVDKIIVSSHDTKKIEAYRDYYQNRHDSPLFKERTALVQAYVRQFVAKGLSIPLELADFTHPTDRERVNVCDTRLAELKAAKK